MEAGPVAFLLWTFLTVQFPGDVPRTTITATERYPTLVKCEEEGKKFVNKHRELRPKVNRYDCTKVTDPKKTVALSSPRPMVVGR